MKIVECFQSIFIILQSAFFLNPQSAIQSDRPSFAANNARAFFTTNTRRSSGASTFTLPPICNIHRTRESVTRQRMKSCSAPFSRVFSFCVECHLLPPTQADAGGEMRSLISSGSPPRILPKPPARCSSTLKSSGI
jgi:hypothetical protein